jgi:protein TonB
MSVPTFLQQLGLGIDASDKAIRRAYAQRVKLIDQATHPEDFQRLREAYDAALAWHEARERGDAVLDAPPRGKEAALQWFEEFASQQVHDADSAHERLRAFLDDATLLDLEARSHFEGLLVSLLAGGWQTGHEFIFEAAVSAFAWDVDHGRLLPHGAAGALIEAAVLERDRFHEQNPSHISFQHDLMERVRHGRRPSDTDLIRTMRVLDWLASNYPHWLGMTVGRANVEQWDAWHALLPADRRSLDGAWPEPTHPPQWLGEEGRRGAAEIPTPERSQYGHLMVYAYFMVCFLGALVLGAYLSDRYGWTRGY